jgi:acyl-CoA synthetase
VAQADAVHAADGACGAAAEPGELLRHLNEAGLSRYDMPEYFIAMTEYPLTASGKILKRELVEWAKSGHIRPEPVRWTDPARSQE